MIFVARASTETTCNQEISNKFVFQMCCLVHIVNAWCPGEPTTVGDSEPLSSAGGGEAKD